MQFGIIGSGSWATALAKILTDNRHQIDWCVRSQEMIRHLHQRHHNPKYLSSVYFDTALLRLHTDVNVLLTNADCIIIAVPSAYAAEILGFAGKQAFRDKKIISAIKGILPEHTLLLNEYLAAEFDMKSEDYFTVMGPCHAEEVAQEKLSYLTFSGSDAVVAKEIAGHFTTEYLNTIVNDDVTGVQYAAVLKNIYALGAGIAHGLEYGDNFLSVLIANCADEMGGFLRRSCLAKGVDLVSDQSERGTHQKAPGVEKTYNYASSVYLGDLLVTCYSLFSRNRTFGNMIGKGYSVNATKIEMNMVAEGYTASKCIFSINKRVSAPMPIADSIYRILWEHQHPRDAFRQIEQALV